MNMIWHDNKAGADACSLMQARTKVSNNDSFRVVLRKKLTSVEARERDEMNVSLIVNNSTGSLQFHHGETLSDKTTLSL